MKYIFLCAMLVSLQGWAAGSADGFNLNEPEVAISRQVFFRSDRDRDQHAQVVWPVNIIEKNETHKVTIRFTPNVNDDFESVSLFDFFALVEQQNPEFLDKKSTWEEEGNFVLVSGLKEGPSPSYERKFRLLKEITANELWHSQEEAKWSKNQLRQVGMPENTIIEDTDASGGCYTTRTDGSLLYERGEQKVPFTVTFAKART